MATSHYQPNGHDESGAASFKRGRQEARAVGSMVAEIANDIRGLATKEVALAQAEAKETVSITVRAVVWGAVAAVFAMLLLTWITLSIMFALAEVWPFWAASLATTGIVLLVTAIAGFLAYRRIKQISITPQRTIETIREDMTWARSQMTSPGTSASSAPR